METLKNLSGKQKFIIGLIIGLIVGWGGTYLSLEQGALSALKCSPGESTIDCAQRLAKIKSGVVKDKRDSAKIGNGGAMTDSKLPGTTVLGPNAVAVEDQLAGSLVEVTMVTLSQGGWVVVHEDNPIVPGIPGKVLGARRYDPGLYLGEVELLRATEVGKTYYVMLHIDDGDRQFDLGKDLPIKDAGGMLVMDSFVAK